MSTQPITIQPRCNLDTEMDTLVLDQPFSIKIGDLVLEVRPADKPDRLQLTVYDWGRIIVSPSAANAITLGKEAL